MKNNLFDKSRRDFIKLSSLGAFALHPTISVLANWLNADKEYLEKSFFDDDFHYFGNNLTNLHFYFIGAEIKGKKLSRKKDTSSPFMVVKIPQQHVQEQLLREKTENGLVGFNPDYIDPDKRTESKISGFSFLAFKIKGLSDDHLHIDINDIAILLEWDNPSLFELLIPQKEDYKNFLAPDWISFKTSPETLIEDNEANPTSGYVGSLYRTICDKVFNKNHFPLTVLEIPEGLLVAPYHQDPKATPIAETYRIPKKQFVYSGLNGEIVRTVEEIWSTQLFFETVEGRISPPLRGLGYIPRKEKLGDSIDSECPDELIKYLPTLLDKKEIVYLTSLGRKVNEGKEWNIETRGLTLTGLGVIAKFHYKNYNPPCESDLVEYEHHFTLGRDEYIKVARIGVISVTGQKALHVKIGQRKIKKGTSYMEFKEYIEIIQKEIKYFDEDLFIKNELNKKEPFNYIQARSNTNRSGIVHSFDDIYGDIYSTIYNEKKENDVWYDRFLWELKYDTKDGKVINYLPQKWNTHYKRWCFKKVSSVKYVTQPLATESDIARKNIMVGDKNCPFAFWPISEVNDIDAKLTFKGVDWDGNESIFESTFIFIRKSLIEEKSEENLKENLNTIYSNFINGKKERRQIQLNSEIAFTPDFVLKSNKGKTLPNKSNKGKTEYIEYYFSLCREGNGELLGMENGKIEPKGSETIGCIFNDRIFPLFPQVKESKIFIENLQSYTPEPLSSIIEYNEDYVNYGFERTKDVEVIIDNKKQNAEVIYNKARLIFNHTDSFRSGKILEQVEENGITKWVETADDGYSKIKQAFSGAGSAIGGLVNPDFDIQSIGLVKQSIAVGKDINKKYEQVTAFTDKIEKFNPSDLLRQAPEIFNGISLIDILQEVFPEYEAPVNDIKNIASQVEQLNADLIEGLDEIKKAIEETKKNLFDLKSKVENDIKKCGYETIQAIIDKKEIELKTLRDELNNKHQFSDLSNLIKSVEEYSKIIGLEFDQNELTINPTKLNVVEIAKSISTQILSKLELILKLQFDIRDALETLNPDFVELKPRFDILNARYNFFIGLFLKDPKKPELGLKSFETIVDHRLKGSLPYIINTQKQHFSYYDISQKALNSQKIKLVKGEIKEISKEILLEFETKKIEFEKPISEIKSEIKAFKETIDKIISRIKEDSSKDFEKLKDELISIETKARSIYEIILSVELSYVVESFEKAKKEYEIAKTKICQIDEITKKPKVTIEDLKKLINNRNEIGNALKNQTKSLEAFFLSDEFKAISILVADGTNNTIDLNKVIQKVNFKVNEYNIAYQNNVNILWSKIKSINNLRGKIKVIESELYDGVNGYKVILQDRIKQYEDKLSECITQEAKGVVGILKDKIQNIEKQIIDEPDKKDLKNLLIQSKQLYNTLISISKKEINYTWQTSSFKNADFGIVSFLASTNPKTALSVNVKNTIYFQPNKFPAVIQKIEAIAENRLSNFGISLLKAIIINFNEVSFFAGTNQKPKFEVKIRDVQFAGAFSFVQALESLFKQLLGDNFSVRISPQNVEVEYLLPIPYVGAPSFGFKNILFRVLYTLYFDKKPMELGVGIGSPANRTILSVGVYTGFFYFIVIGNPKQGITTIEVSIEFGGYFGLSLGPLRGEVKLAVGLYYRKDLTGVIMEGYFLCLGSVKLWCFSVTARFYMGVRSNGNYVEGRCTVTYKIKISRFFTRSFSATYYKKLAGATPGNNQSGSNLESLKLFNTASTSQEKKDYLKLNAITNPKKREVIPLNEVQWEKFLNSYID